MQPVNAKPVEEVSFVVRSSDEAVIMPCGSTAGEVAELSPLKLKFSGCPATTCQMGSAPDAPGHMLNEGPFEAILSKGLWMQQSELTQTQYEAVVGVNPAAFPCDENPFESLNWDEAPEYFRRLNELSSESTLGNKYRLPTETEWEYAWRAGASTEFKFGDDKEQMVKYAWFHKNSNRTNHSVATRKPNALGLFEMH